MARWCNSHGLVNRQAVLPRRKVQVQVTTTLYVTVVLVKWTARAGALMYNNTFYCFNGYRIITPCKSLGMSVRHTR